MTHSPKGCELSPGYLTVAERLQRPLGRIGAPLVRYVTGSDSPAYISLDWHSEHHMEPSMIRAWSYSSGDKHAGLSSRFWDMAVILSAETAQLEEAQQVNSEAEEAVAYLDAVDRVHIGVMPEKRALFAAIEESTARGVAMRLGRGALRASVGYYDHRSHHFESAGAITASPTLVPTEQIAQIYPGLLLV
jgi:hypothetical protein